MTFTSKYDLELIETIKRRFSEEHVTRKELAGEYGIPNSNVNLWCKGIEKKVDKLPLNRYEVQGEITVVFIKCKGEIYECIIDTDDLEKVNSFPYTWLGIDHEGRIYAYGSIQKNRKTVSRHLMHRFLMNPPDGMVVDHINGNSLDNRKSNLRIVTNAQNMQNRKVHSNSLTGVRGVTWHKVRKYYAVRCTIDGKSTEIARCKTLEEASKLAVEARRKYMPYSEN